MGWASRFMKPRKADMQKEQVLTTGAPGRIVLGGRAFRQISEHTVQQELTFAGLIGAARLEQVYMREGETGEEYGRRLVFTFAQDATAVQLIACLLVPEDMVKPGEDPAQVWTPAMMAETAEFIDHLTAPADKATITMILASMVAGFFVREIVSPRTSQRSSGPAMTETVPQTGATASGLSS